MLREIEELKIKDKITIEDKQMLRKALDGIKDGSSIRLQ